MAADGISDVSSMIGVKVEVEEFKTQVKQHESDNEEMKID